MEQNEILEETRRTNELLRGQLLWTRVAAALLAVLLTAVVAVSYTHLPVSSAKMMSTLASVPMEARAALGENGSAQLPHSTCLLYTSRCV